MYAWILFPCCGGIMGGVLLASVWDISAVSLVVPGIVLVFSMMLGWLRGVSSTLLIATVALCSALLVGALRFEMADRAYSAESIQLQNVTSVTGVVVTEPESRASSQRFVLATDIGPKVVISADKYIDIAYGDKVQVSGQLEEPKSFTTDFGRVFDYPGYLRAKGITYTMSFATPEVIESDAGNPCIANLLAIKRQFLIQIAQTLPEPESGLAAGLLLGVKQSLGADLERDFQIAGLTHIVVLSGYNIMLVIAFATWMLSYVLPWRIRLVASMVVVVVFMLLVGTGPSVVRASVMALLLLVASLVGRRYDVMRALVVTATGMVVLNPYILQYDIGFQFSMLATFGLVVVAPELESLLIKIPSLGIRTLVTATLATQIAVLPLLAYHIGSLSVVSILANVLALPMVPFAMLGSFATGLVSMVVPVLAPVVAAPTYIALTYIVHVAEITARFPYAAISVPVFSAYWIIPGYLVIGLLWWCLYRTRPIAKIPASNDAETPVFFVR